MSCSTRRPFCARLRWKPQRVACLAKAWGLGYARSALLFGGLIAAVFLAYRYLHLNAVLTFWAAYILTHPLRHFHG